MSKSESTYSPGTSYAIKDLEHLSGIKAHTLRIWEQRYGLLNPERTETNIRYYTDEDLKYILNIALLNNNGYKISMIAKMSREDVEQAVKDLSAEHPTYETDISSLIISTVDLNESLFEQVFQSNVIKIGLEKTFTEIIYPFLDRIGVLWLSGSICPAQEHFISNLIRQKLIVSIDAQPKLPKDNPDKVVIYTPEQEMHELSILFATYVFKKRQDRVYYLGSNVPFENVQMVVDRHNVDTLVLSITAHPSGKSFNAYLDKLNNAFPNKKIILFGYQVNNRLSEVPDNMLVMEKLSDLFAYVNR